VELLRQRTGLGIAAIGSVVGYGIALLVRAQPWQIGESAWVRVDSLSAFFILIVLLSLASLFGLAGSAFHRYAALGIVTVAFLSPSIPIICLALLLGSCVWNYTLLSRHRFSRMLGELLPALLLSVAWLGMSVSSDVWNYSDRNAGVALQSWIFALTLAATLLGSHTLLRHFLPDWLRLKVVQMDEQTASLSWADSLFGLVWLYPLLRLYSFGPWNTGWSLATLLLGCGLCFWSISQHFQARNSLPTSSMVYGLISLSIATAGLGSAAGVAAALVGLLSAVWLQAALIALEGSENSSLQIWLISGAVPITLPFVAIWLAMSAALGAGVVLAAGLFWLLGLSNAITILRLAPKSSKAEAGFDWATLWRGSGIFASLSLLFGIWMPGLLDQIILPVARQLQGGLTPYGDLTVWPWLGISALNSGRQQIAALPSLVLAALMAILCALAWLTARLFGQHADDE
jgi:hypothetical protein